MASSILIPPLAALLLFVMVGNEGRRRAIFLLPAYSLLVLALLDGRALVSLLALVLPVFAAGEVAAWSGKRWAKAAVVTFAVGWFCVLKNYFDLAKLGVEALCPGQCTGLTQFLGTLGLSFVVFRTIEYVLVGHAASIGRPVYSRLWTYIGFCLAFPTVASGPILRWRGFMSDASDRPIFEDEDDLMRTLHRLSNGLLAVSLLSQPLVLSVGLADRLLSNQDLQTGPAMAWLLLTAVFYLHALYVNFASYSSVMIASGRFAALRVPENFVAPFSSYGFLDFFNHWHLSVSQWFRDFVFTPISRTLIIRGWKSNILVSMLAFMATFGLLGLWHGRSWPFVLCGVLLGLGGVTNQLYRDTLRKRLRKLAVQPFLRRATVECARAFTYVYIALAIMGLWLNPSTLASFWLSVPSLRFLGVLFVVVLAYAIVITAISWLTARLGLTMGRIERAGLAGGLAAVVVKAAVAIAFLQLVSVDTAGGFVYEGF